MNTSPLNTGFRLLEATSYRAPLSFQFVDAVGATLVGDGLAVTAWPAGDPGAWRSARRSPVSTILGFGRLPGLSLTAEATTGSLGSPPGPSRPFAVRVTDSLGRYLPQLLAIDVPQPAPVTPTLFSAPNRAAPSGWATIGGEVWTQPTATSLTAPASWALVTVLAGSTSYRAMADQQGRFLAYLPYPEALPPLSLSPPTAATPLTWPVTISVQYQPSAQVTLSDAGPTDPPEYSSLVGQAAAVGVDPPGAALLFGTPLVLKVQVVPA